MFSRSENGVWQSSLLLDVPGVDHGFASRHAGEWPGKYAGVRQIHSADVVDADSDKPQPADALVTATPGRWIGIRTADCVPVLIADRRGGAVAAVHAGRRGTVAQIARRAVQELAARYSLAPADMVAAVGPCIAQCCFEVGPEVEEQFAPLSGPARRQGYVDLNEANRIQLLAAGLRPASIDVAGLCTRCDGGEFHSWRRDRERSGRMVAAIRILQM